MAQIGKLIAQPAALATMYAERLLNGLTAAQFARFARPGGVEIRSNHPAFVFGHLSMYPVRVMQGLGLDPGPTAVPEGWEPLFRNGVECIDDPEGKVYPAMEFLTRHFFASYQAAAQAVADAPDEKLIAPNPAEGRMKELFPNVGGAFSFYLAAHPQSHLGQVSAWRRMMGLPAA